MMSVKIESYSFGEMVAGEKTYTSDLMICGDEVCEGWWRREGHRLCLEDLVWMLNRKPQILIIGTGNMGCMTVPEDVLKALADRGIQVKTASTSEAVNLYNDLRDLKNRRVGAAFHLTC